MRILGLIAASAPLLWSQPAVRFDAGTISGLPARNIGSAMMSGRVAAVAAVNDNGHFTVFAGSASGGVWKSVNGGTSFKPVFDDAAVQSIGAVAIDPHNPKIVWVGTGESWVRNSVSIGDGIYRSADGGENWTNMGSYKKVAGVYFPFSLESGGKRQDPADFAKITIEKIEANVAVNPAEFKMPVAAPAPGGREF